MAFKKKSVNKKTQASNASQELFPELLNNFTKQRQVTIDDDPKMAYIMARFMSMCSSGFVTAATYNDYSLNIPAWARRILLYNLTPKISKPPYMKYAGRKGEKFDTKKEETIAKLQSVLNIKKQHAIETYEVLMAEGKNPANILGIK